MKITDERKTTKKPFSEIKVGDIFEWRESRDMRICAIYEADNRDNIIANAINMEISRMIEFANDVLVTPLDAELIIRG